MNPIKFDGAKIIGKPKHWNEDRDGECVGLPAQISTTESGMVMVTSIWKPTDEERQALARGENVAISCFGAQVPIALSVTAIDGEVVRFAHEAPSESK